MSTESGWECERVYLCDNLTDSEDEMETELSERHGNSEQWLAQEIDVEAVLKRVEVTGRETHI